MTNVQKNLNLKCKSENTGYIYSVSQKSSPPLKLFCDIFTCGEPV